jgi:hypothetical protein
MFRPSIRQQFTAETTSLITWCSMLGAALANSQPCGEPGNAQPPLVRLTINPMKRGWKRVTQNPTGNPRKQGAKSSASERMSLRY